MQKHQPSVRFGFFRMQGLARQKGSPFLFFLLLLLLLRISILFVAGITERQRRVVAVAVLVVVLVLLIVRNLHKRSVQRSIELMLLCGTVVVVVVAPLPFSPSLLLPCCGVVPSAAFVVWLSASARP